MEQDIAATASAAAAATPFATECDLVMKGGITSGVVYPLAIAEIAKAFRLRCIGGTSAGAIAASAAAAAELRRQRGKGDMAGFALLERLPSDLCETSAGGKGTRLLAFFKPAAALAPIFNAALGALDKQTMTARIAAAAGGLLRNFWPLALLGFAMGTLPLWWTPLSRTTALTWLLLTVFGVVLAVAAVAWRALAGLVRGLVANRFGFCSGMPAHNDPHPQEALTAWLAAYLDQLSGQDALHPGKPLTFGDLWEHGVELEMMTTCLTLGRPFRIPFRDETDVRENKQFFVKEADFAQLFPPYVVAWMKANQRPLFKGDASPAMSSLDFTGLLRMPDPKDLPVVVGARMSLSFPILLSAVPLYAVDFHAKPAPGSAPERCWFTDGGLGSNFPIHFFDAPLPTRPTFGLDLGELHENESRRVQFPANNGQSRLTRWRRFGSEGFAALGGFLGTLLGVAKDWNHDTLSHLPGFRDRIGMVLLTKEEGGLNLTMPKERIALLTQLGREAGQEFVRRFGDPHLCAPPEPKMNWDNHQSIRVRLLLASMAEFLERLNASYTRLAGTRQDYDRFFEAASGFRSYPFDGAGQPGSQADVARTVLRKLIDIARMLPAPVDGMPHPTDPRTGAPKPLPELKPRPRV